MTAEGGSIQKQRTLAGLPGGFVDQARDSSGWEISERWLAFTSMVLAPMRLAMKRSRSGLIVRSSVETA